MSNPQITLYTCPTPNGHKISIALEQLGLTYKAIKVDLANNEQKEEWFLKINPNGRVPAIVDHTNNDFAVFETGAILLYLADKHDPEYKLLPKDANLRSEAIQWLMWQMGGLGPMMGQAFFFLRYAPEKIEYAINRYKAESKRLISVLESRLEGRTYLVGDSSTVADLASYPWARFAFMLDIDIDAHPNVKKWLAHFEQIDFVQKGLNVPDEDPIKKFQGVKLE